MEHTQNVIGCASVLGVLAKRKVGLDAFTLISTVATKADAIGELNFDAGSMPWRSPRPERGSRVAAFELIAHAGGGPSVMTLSLRCAMKMQCVRYRARSSAFR